MGESTVRGRLLLLALAITTPVVAADVPPPYQADLLRFSEVIGAVTYLDRLCGTSSDDWRARMGALLDAQGLEGAARRPYVEAFNRGQRSFSVAHRSCTTAARGALQSYLAEGASLSDRIAQRFGSSAKPAPVAVP